MPVLSIIVPCYYNEGNIPLLTSRFIEAESLFPDDLKIQYVFVDDGSKDRTYEMLLKFHHQYPEKVRVLKLAGNVGSHNAVLAGMHHSSGDCHCMISADLQDPPELIPKMFSYWQKGIKLVIANRDQREEGIFTKLFASFYHRMIKRYALPNIPPNGFDVVLFDEQIRNELVKMNEKNTSITYLMSWLQFDYVSIPYTRLKREIGKSRWTVKKKIKLFIDSFVSFSFFPIRAISFLGLILGILSFTYGIAIIIAKISGKIQVEGWAASMAVMLLLSSFQMIALGIIGEYVWRTLDASRQRPNFIVDKYHGSENFIKHQNESGKIP
jgi:glycosyltransferase involved in cell wall biosynthesis